MPDSQLRITLDAGREPVQIDVPLSHDDVTITAVIRVTAGVPSMHFDPVVMPVDIPKQ